MFRDDLKSGLTVLLQHGVLLVALSAPTAGFAQEAANCPDREAVRAALSALAGDTRGRADVAELERAELELQDLGSRYRVTVNGQSREYSDPARDCTARAQVAAVFTALVLNPNGEDALASPDPVTPPQAPAPRPIVKPRVPSSVQQVRARRIDVRVGALQSWAFAAEGTPHATSVLLRGAYAPGALGLELGVALPISTAELPVASVRAELRRYQFDLSARFGFAAGALGVDLEAGALLSVLRFQNESNGAGPAVTRLEPGVRLGAGLRLREPRISPALGMFCSWIPMRYQLALEPSGVLARTPAAWVGGWVGLSAAFD